MLPADIPQPTNLDLAVYMKTATEVGGDYYDVFDMAPRRVGAVIADVSGHSVSSGLLMAAARCAMQLLIRQYDRPADILRQLNETLYQDLDQTTRAGGHRS